MASGCIRLCLISVTILFCVQIEGISAVEGTEYYHYSTINNDKSQYNLAVSKFESLEKERARRYVNGPISKLADTYGQSKSRFVSNPQALTNEYSEVSKEEAKHSDIAAQPLPPASDTNENRVRNNDSQSSNPPVISNNKPPANPVPLVAANVSASSIVSADFDSTLSSTTLPTIDDELPISKFNDDVVNNVINQNNLTSKKEDNHLFYNSSFIVDSKVGQSFWVDMNKDDVITNSMLSQSHRRAATVKLLFNFPFYGHMVRNVTIATGGFLYTGDYVHSWLAATQYIAPLMANFDTSINKGSYVKYVDNGTAFTVQWEKVVLQDKPESGNFTFQATLHANGDIVFVYQNIPVEIENIQDDQHPVKVGLSDAYIIDRTIFFVRRKTIYEYHRVNFKKEDIKNWTTIYLKALPTCLDKKDCESCLTQDIGFECSWCPEANRCSTGMDRMRQDWLHKECDKVDIGNISSCNQPDPEHSQHTSVDGGTVKAGLQIVPGDGKSSDQGRVGMSSILGFLFLIVLICGIGIWALYAYNNPHSSSGQILIKYRPSQWSWRRGEARYTAATIHM